MKASVAIQVLPDVSNEDELIRIVDEVIAYIKSTGLNYYVARLKPLSRVKATMNLWKLLQTAKRLQSKLAVQV